MPESELHRGYDLEIETLETHCPEAIVKLHGETYEGWAVELSSKKTTVVICKPNGSLTSLKGG